LSNTREQFCSSWSTLEGPVARQMNDPRAIEQRASPAWIAARKRPKNGPGQRTMSSAAAPGHGDAAQRRA